MVVKLVMTDAELLEVVDETGLNVVPLM